MDDEASAEAAAVAVVGTGAVERSRRLMALVVCGGLWVVAGEGALGVAG